jgi:phosphatidylinositol alpha-mannosyltransferase
MTGARPDRPLRIGICASYDLGRAGGVNSHVRAQAASLRRLGHDVCIFGATSAPLRPDEASLGGCISLVVGDTETAFGIDPRSWWMSKRLLRARQFDVLHMHEPLMPLPSWFVLWQARVPVVATFHIPRARPQIVQRWIFDPDETDCRELCRSGEANCGRVFPRWTPRSYRNAIDVDRWRACGVRRPCRPDPVTFYVGRLEPRKGIDRLIRAMPWSGVKARARS